MESTGKPKGPPTQAQAEGIFDNFRQIMEIGARDPIFGHRLSLAQTIAHVHCTDADDLTLTLLLDREPIEVAEGDVGDAEIELFISSTDVDRFWSGEMHLAMAIAEGDVQYKGPVRKLLRIVPIVLRMTPQYIQMRNGGAE